MKKIVLISSIVLAVLLITLAILFVLLSSLRTANIGNYVGGIAPMYEKSYVESSIDRSYVEDSIMYNNNQGSKVRKNGDMSMLVKNIDDSFDSLKNINTKYTGEINNVYDSGSGNSRYLRVTTKIPVDNFDKYFEEVKSSDGEVTYINVSTADVTEEYIDITSRLKNLREVETQLQEILKQADNVKDVLAVQSELSRVRGEIESYEGRKRYFDSQTDYAYLNVTFSLDKEGLKIAEDQWKPVGEFKAALNAFVDVLKALVNLGIWILVFSPLVLIPTGIVLVIAKRKK
jgi:hypothetical protein